MSHKIFQAVTLCTNVNASDAVHHLAIRIFNILVMCSYAGEHYTITQMGGIDQHFNKSSDGVNWEPVNPENEVPYRGKVSTDDMDESLRGLEGRLRVWIPD